VKLNGNCEWKQVMQAVNVPAIMNCMDVVRVDTVQLCQLGKNQVSGGMEGIVCIKSHLLSIVSFFGMADKWTADMFRETADIAYKECYWLSLAELQHFVNRVKAGKYSSQKNFNPAIFMEWLNEFSDEIHATRGAVKGYDYKKNTIQVDKELVSDPTAKRVIDYLVPMFMEAKERIIREDRERELKHRRDVRQAADLQIILLVEQDAMQGIAPLPTMRNEFFKALERTKQYEADATDNKGMSTRI